MLGQVLNGFIRFQEGKDLVSLNFGLKKVYLTPSGRAHYAPSSDHIFLAVPASPSMTAETKRTFYHEMGHGILIQHVASELIPFPIAKSVLKNFAAKYGYSEIGSLETAFDRSRAAHAILERIYETREASKAIIHDYAEQLVSQSALQPGQNYEELVDRKRAQIVRDSGLGVDLWHDYMFFVPVNDRMFFRNATPEQMRHRRNFDEFFAEYFQLFFNQPELLRTFDPVMFDFLSILTGIRPEFTEEEGPAAETFEAPFSETAIRLVELLDLAELEALLESVQMKQPISPATLEKMEQQGGAEMVNLLSSRMMPQLFEYYLQSKHGESAEGRSFTKEVLLERIKVRNAISEREHNHRLSLIEDSRQGFPLVHAELKLQIGKLIGDQGAAEVVRAAGEMLAQRKENAMLFSKESSTERKIINIIGKLREVNYFLRIVDDWRLLDDMLNRVVQDPGSFEDRPIAAQPASEDIQDVVRSEVRTETEQAAGETPKTFYRLLTVYQTVRFLLEKVLGSDFRNYADKVLDNYSEEFEKMKKLAGDSLLQVNTDIEKLNDELIRDLQERAGAEDALGRIQSEDYLKYVEAKVAEFNLSEVITPADVVEALRDVVRQDILGASVVVEIEIQNADFEAIQAMDNIEMTQDLLQAAVSELAAANPAYKDMPSAPAVQGKPGLGNPALVIGAEFLPSPEDEEAFENMVPVLKFISENQGLVIAFEAGSAGAAIAQAFKERIGSIRILGRKSGEAIDLTPVSGAAYENGFRGIFPHGVTVKKARASQVNLGEVSFSAHPSFAKNPAIGGEPGFLKMALLIFGSPILMNFLEGINDSSRPSRMTEKAFGKLAQFMSDLAQTQAIRQAVARAA